MENLIPKSSLSNERITIKDKLFRLLRKRSSRDLLEKKGIIKMEPIFGKQSHRQKYRIFVIFMDTKQKKNSIKVIKSEKAKYAIFLSIHQFFKSDTYLAKYFTGNTLRYLHINYKTSVPEFVTKTIKLIELPKNITSQGVYRASGNLATIQKIRCEIDRNNIKILDQFADEVDVLTGSLKLFFRELSEPLVDFKTYNEFVNLLGKQFSKRSQSSAQQQWVFLGSIRD